MSGRLFNWTDLLRIARKVYKDQPKTAKEAANAFRCCNYIFYGFKRLLEYVCQGDRERGLFGKAVNDDGYDVASKGFYYLVTALQGASRREFIREDVYNIIQDVIKRGFRYVEAETLVEYVRRAHAIGYAEGRAILLEQLIIRIAGEIREGLLALVGRDLDYIIDRILPAPPPRKLLPAPEGG